MKAELRLMMTAMWGLHQNQLGCQMGMAMSLMSQGWRTNRNVHRTHPRMERQEIRVKIPRRLDLLSLLPLHLQLLLGAACP